MNAPNELKNPYAGVEQLPSKNGYPAHIRVASTALRADVNTIKGVMLEYGWSSICVNKLIKHLALYIEKHNLSIENRDEFITYINELLTENISAGQRREVHDGGRTASVCAGNPGETEQPTNRARKQTNAKAKNRSRKHEVASA